MVDWKGVGTALMRAEGQWFTDIAELALDRKLDWDHGSALVAERAEAVQHTMLEEWRAAGVTYPLTLYGAIAESAGALFLLGMVMAPGRTLRLVGTMSVVGGLYGASQAFQRRRAAGPAEELQQPPQQPLRPFGEQGTPYRSSGM